MTLADDRTTLMAQRIGPLEPAEDPDSFTSADDPNVSAQGGDSESDQRQPPQHKTDSASSRQNALQDDLAAVGKSRPSKQRTTAG